MRVISGLLRGKRIIAPKDQSTRPTSDRLKETLFNILQGQVCGARFLDVFSGTGGVGIEALSRGSEKVIFIESNRECGELIKRNLADTPVSCRADIIISDFSAAINALGKKNEKFNIIFLDPPYYSDFTEKAINAILKNDLLHVNGILISEQGSKDPILDYEGLKPYDVRNYKTTAFVFYSACGHS
jgi:16S rRNA (guanine(966)-N(2))-methyltransferase RsmD